MSEMDELEKCMWFLAGTGWVHYLNANGGHVFKSPPLGSGHAFWQVTFWQDSGIVENYFGSFTQVSVKVDDMFTGVVLAYLGWNTHNDSTAIRNNDSYTYQSSFVLQHDAPGADQPYGGTTGTDGQWMHLYGAFRNAVPKGRIVGIDMIERRHGFLWIIGWQEPDDGEA